MTIEATGIFPDSGAIAAIEGAIGGGLFLSPFNMVTLQASYAVSDDDALVDVRLGFFF